MTDGKGRTSPWVYIGCGCGAAAILGVVALVAVLVFGARKAKEFEQAMNDPEVRREKVLDVLGGDIPEGYYPVMGMEIPFLFEMALLSDVPPGEDGELDGSMGEHGFIYMTMRARKGQREDVEDFFEGRTNDLDALRRSNIKLGRGEVIDRGSFDLDTFGVRWIAKRGSIEMGGSRSRGLTSALLFQCPDDTSGSQRLGIWFGPDEAAEAAPAPEASTAASAEANPASESEAYGVPTLTPSTGATSLTGTVADEDALRAFVSHFEPCG
jgi:hypothetical protein